MLKKTLLRGGLIVGLLALAGCSATGGSSLTKRLFSECTWDRTSCMYDGPYDAGEEAYAEREAARLNKSQSRKVGR